MTEKNIYILTFEYSQDKDGISYTDLLSYLDSIKQKPSGQFEHYFHIWFYKNFWVKDMTHLLHNSTNSMMEDISNLIQYDNKKAIMTGDAYFEYQEYQTLLQTRKDAKYARTVAIIAIIISIVIGLIQIGIQVFQNNSIPTFINKFYKCVCQHT